MPAYKVNIGKRSCGKSCRMMTGPDKAAEGEYGCVDGTKDDDERVHVRAVFANPGKTEPILITAGAGGAGMNLTAGTHLIQTEFWWNGNDDLLRTSHRSSRYYR
jgi:hypothetical protein